MSVRTISSKAFLSVEKAIDQAQDPVTITTFGLTENQQNALAILPKVTSPFSMVGSIMIILDIIKSRAKIGRTYSRLMLGMSFMDLCLSTSTFFSTWPIPEGTEGMAMASGTTQTCTLQGFFYQLGLGAALYNCSLSFYYLVVIAFNWSNETMKRFEWVFLAIPVYISIGFAISGIPLTLYNSAGVWCWISALPATCLNGNTPYGNGDCIRGEYAYFFRWIFFYVPLWLCIAIVTINMATVVYLVSAKERASRRFRFSSSSRTNHNSNLPPGRVDGAASAAAGAVVTADNTATNDDDDGKNDNDETNNPTTTNSSLRSATSQDDTNNKKTSLFSRLCGCFCPCWKEKKPSEPPSLATQVARQAFFYVGVFYLTWGPATVMKFQDTLDKPVPFWVVLGVTGLTPLQGWLNFLVYIRPRVLRYQRENPHMTVTGAFQRAVARVFNMFGFPYSNNYDAERDEEIDVVLLDPSGSIHLEDSSDPASKLRLLKVSQVSSTNSRRSRNMRPSTSGSRANSGGSLITAEERKGSDADDMFEPVDGPVFSERQEQSDSDSN